MKKITECLHEICEEARSYKTLGGAANVVLPLGIPKKKKKSLRITLR